MKKLSLITGLLLILVLSGVAQASSDLMGMGNAPGAAARGDNGLEWNPAAIDAGKGVFALDLMILNTTLWTNSFSVYDILNYGGLVEGTDSDWDADEVNNILNLIPGSGFSVNAGHTSMLKMIIGPVGLSASADVHAIGRLDKDLFNLILKGNDAYVDPEGNGGYEKLLDLTDTKAEVLATTDPGLTIALPLHKFDFIQEATRSYFDELYFGGAYHFVVGGYGTVYLTENTKFYIGYDENGLPTLRLADGELDQSLKEKLADWAVTHPGELFPLLRAEFTSDISHIGTGSAIDLGIYARKDKLSLGLSLMNAGSYTINNAQVIEFGLLPDSNEDSLLGGTISPNPEVSELNEAKKVSLPWRLNAGVSYKPWYWLQAGAQFTGTKAASDLFYSEIGAGVEINPILVLPLRIGTSYSFAKRSLTYTGGFGLHLGPLKTDLALSLDAKSAALGLNTSIEF